MVRRDIVIHPSDLLKQKSSEVFEFGYTLESLVEEMIDVMYFARGAGLAAPQLGYAQRVVVIDPSNGEQNDNLRILVNPRITWSSPQRVVDKEACLSIPNVLVDVDRATTVEIEYQDVKGQTHHVCYTGWAARIVQHELDHLDGILIIDRAHQMAQDNLSKN